MEERLPSYRCGSSVALGSGLLVPGLPSRALMLAAARPGSPRCDSTGKGEATELMEERL